MIYDFHKLIYSSTVNEFNNGSFEGEKTINKLHFNDVKLPRNALENSRVLERNRHDIIKFYIFPLLHFASTSMSNCSFAHLRRIQ